MGNADDLQPRLVSAAIVVGVVSRASHFRNAAGLLLADPARISSPARASWHEARRVDRLATLSNLGSRAQRTATPACAIEFSPPGWLHTRVLRNAGHACGLNGARKK